MNQKATRYLNQRLLEMTNWIKCREKTKFSKSAVEKSPANTGVEIKNVKKDLNQKLLVVIQEEELNKIQRNMKGSFGKT